MQSDTCSRVTKEDEKNEERARMGQSAYLQRAQKNTKVFFVIGNMPKMMQCHHLFGNRKSIIYATLIQPF